MDVEVLATTLRWTSLAQSGTAHILRLLASSEIDVEQLHSAALLASRVRRSMPAASWNALILSLVLALGETVQECEEAQ